MKQNLKVKCPKCGSVKVWSYGKQWKCRDCSKRWSKIIGKPGRPREERYVPPGYSKKQAEAHYKGERIDRTVERHDARFDWDKINEKIRLTPPNYANSKLKLTGYHSWWNTDRFVWSPVYADKVTGETHGVNLEKFKIPMFKNNWKDVDNPPPFEDRATNTWPEDWPPGECPSEKEYKRLNREAYLKRRGQGLLEEKI
jgi:hypothetical protein